MGIKRIKNKYGFVRYEDDNGNPAKLSDYTKELYSKGKRLPKDANGNERRSMSARTRLRVNNQFIAKSREKFVREELESLEELDKLKGNDIGRTYAPQVVEDLLNRRITSWTNTVDKNHFNVANKIASSMQGGKALTYKAADGEIYIGLEALEQLETDKAQRLSDFYEEHGKSDILLYQIEEDGDGIYIDYEKIESVYDG